jgi:hypothetical protein
MDKDRKVDRVTASVVAARCVARRRITVKRKGERRCKGTKGMNSSGCKEVERDLGNKPSEMGMLGGIFISQPTVRC